MNPIVSSDLVGNYVGDVVDHAQSEKLSSRELVSEAQQISRAQMQRIFDADAAEMPQLPKRVPAKHRSVRVKARKQARLTRKANR